MIDNYRLAECMKLFNNNKILDGLKNIDKELNIIWNYSIDILFEIVKLDSYNDLNDVNLKEEYLRSYYTSDQFYQEITDIMAELLNFYYSKTKKDKKAVNKEIKDNDIEFPFEYECERMSLSLEFSVLSKYDLKNKEVFNSMDNKDEILKLLKKLKTCKKIGMISTMGYGIYREFFEMKNGSLLMIKCVSTKEKYYVREIIKYYKKRG